MTTQTYTVGVYVMRTWATGRPRSTGVRTFTITEDASIMGGIRAINAAVAMCDGHDMCDVAPPTIDPNPALLGWPVGVPA